MKKTEKNKISGYTVVELLAVVSILVIISGIIAAILYSTLRGSNKTKITTDLSQNGSYALSVIANTIVDSEDVTNVGGNDISDCTASPSGTSITLKRIDGSQTSFSCSNEESGGIISSGSASLIDVSKVQVKKDTCFFYCDQKNGDPYAIPIVGVAFTLEDQNAVQEENTGTAKFETSVSLRNFSP